MPLNLSDADVTLIAKAAVDASILAGKRDRPWTLKGMEPVPFSGGVKEDARAWWNQIEGVFELNSVSDENRVMALKLLMRDVPRIWWEGLENSQPMEHGKLKPLKLDFVKDKFLTRFSNESSRWQTQETLDNVRLQVNGDVDKFINEILMLSYKLSLSEKEIITCMMRSLHDELKGFVIASCPKGLEEVVNKIRLGNATIAMARKGRTRGDIRAIQSHENTHTREDLLLDNMEIRMHAMADNAQEAIRAVSTQPHTGQRRPWEESQQKHAFSTDAAPNRPSDFRNKTNDNNKDYARNMECYACHKMGHMARDCRSNPAGARPKQIGAYVRPGQNARNWSSPIQYRNGTNNNSRQNNANNPRAAQTHTERVWQPYSGLTKNRLN